MFGINMSTPKIVATSLHVKSGIVVNVGFGISGRREDSIVTSCHLFMTYTGA